MNKQLKSFKTTQLKKSNTRLNTKSYPKELVIVAEGDSWFDYPLKKDIIDYLRKKGFAIENFASAGDTLENMVYGSEYKIKDGKAKFFGPESFSKTLKAIKKYKPQFVLFSAGGNDIVGSEIISYLNHRDTKLRGFVNKKIFRNKLDTMQSTIEHFIKAVTQIKPDVHILMDGYDYAKVNGKGYSFILRNIKGPWILPSMGAKGITVKKDQEKIIKFFVDEFNKMLAKLARKYPAFNHIDLRGLFPKENEWDNEIHLKNNGFKKVAHIYHGRINKLLSVDPTIQYADRLIV